MIRKLNKMPYAKAYVLIEDNNTLKLYSYTTLVAEIKKVNGEDWLACYGLFSATTRKHISAFAKENGYTYQDFKSLAYEPYFFNPATGEIKFFNENF